jgi:hypothetical protein
MIHEYVREDEFSVVTSKLQRTIRLWHIESKSRTSLMSGEVAMSFPSEADT